MKKLTMNLMLATAATLVASTAVSAQTLTAEIPFKFQANGAVMSPGHYRLRAATGEKYFVLLNTDTLKAIVVTGGIPADAPRTWAAKGNPTLAFLCDGNDTCALDQIWTAFGFPAHLYHAQKQESEKRLALIHLAVPLTK
jgi:hypothetical protein